MAQWSARAVVRSAARPRQGTGALRALLLVAVFLGALAWPVPRPEDAATGRLAVPAVTAVPVRYGDAASIVGRGLPPWTVRDAGAEQGTSHQGGALSSAGGGPLPPGARRGVRPVASGESAFPPHEWPHPDRAPPVPAGV